MDSSTRQKVRHRPVGRESTGQAELLITRGHATALGVWLFLGTWVLYSQTLSFDTGSPDTGALLTTLSHKLDIALFGDATRGSHAINVFLHATNCVLLYAFLWITTHRLWVALLVGALFAAHPLHVEPVAWIEGRGQLLSAFFAFAALNIYVRYTRNQQIRTFIAVVLLTALAVLSDLMAITLPLLFLCVDLWPLERFKNDPKKSPAHVFRKMIVDKLALMVLTTLVVALASAAEIASGYGGESGNTGFLDSITTYLAHAIVPIGLNAKGYDYSLNLFGATLALLFGLALTFGAALIVRRVPFVLAGWLWFLIAIAPAALLDSGAHDRHAYLPLAGLLFAVCWAIREFARGRNIAPRIIINLVAALVAILCILSWNQQKYWRDSDAIRLRAINSGWALDDSGNPIEPN